jgi:hypothetical protein
MFTHAIDEIIIIYFSTQSTGPGEPTAAKYLTKTVLLPYK